MPFGKYELLDRIAAGGMAEIFKARYSPAQGVTKQVVIKKILPHYAANKAFIGMFINEARIAIGLSHGNIAQVFDFGDIDGDYFLAMELVDGPPLSKVLKRAKALGIHHLPTEFAVFIAIEVLKGLHYAHTRLDEQGRPLKIVHRDVSPQNVLISFEGQIKLVDFGISRARNAGREQAESKGVKGKFAYFAPEQARNKEIDSRTDVSSAGIVLYEMLTGELPYQGSMYDVMTAIAKGQFMRPRERNAELHPELERIVLKAMALEKTDRYQTAEAFQHELSTFLSAQYPSFNSSQLSMLLQLLFEEELVRESRPVQLPREFVERAQRWKQTSTPAVPDHAGWVDESDPEPDGVADEIATEMANVGHLPDEDDGVETRPLQLPATISLDETPKARLPRFDLPRFHLPVQKTVAFGVAAVLTGFLGVFLVIKLTHGTIDIRSSPLGAAVQVDGQRVSQPTPVQLPNLRSGRQYHIEVSAPGYQSWANDVPLKGGQHLQIDAALQRAERALDEPPRLEPVPVPTPPPALANQPPPDVVTWPTTSRFMLDPNRHRVDLEFAGAGSLPLDPTRSYAVSLNKGPTLGWGFFVVNAAGSQAGALGVMPVLISGSSRLFAYRIPTVLLGGALPEETRPRTLLVQAGRGKTRSYTVAPTLKLADPSGLLVQGLDPKVTYQVVLHQSTPSKQVSQVIIGHPTAGLINTQFEVPQKITAASRLWFTLIVTSGSATSEQPVVEITEVAVSKKPRR